MAKKIYYKSDFDFKLSLTTRDSEGNAKVVPFPECDFEVEFWTCNRARAYRASCIDGNYYNCFREEDGSVHFVFDGHRLGIARLQWEPHFRFPNGIYPDGFQDILRHDYLDIELTECNGGDETSCFSIVIDFSANLPNEQPDIDYKYDVWITGYDDLKKADVIKYLKTNCNYSLKEAKDLVENCPSIILYGVEKDKAIECVNGIVENKGQAVYVIAGTPLPQS